jgi:hypothetical protein
MGDSTRNMKRGESSASPALAGRLLKPGCATVIHSGTVCRAADANGTAPYQRDAPVTGSSGTVRDETPKKVESVKKKKRYNSPESNRVLADGNG